MMVYDRLMVGQRAYGCNGLSVLDYSLEMMSRVVWHGDERAIVRGVLTSTSRHSILEKRIA